VSGGVAVVGYASMDHAMACDEFRGTAGTTLVRSRLSDPWPGIGGIAHAARALAAAGHEVHAITWVGSDEPGSEYVDRLSSYRVHTDGVSPDGARTPSCYLFYGTDGGTVVVYDPGDRGDHSLSGEQREILAGCDWICLLVGPRPVTLDVLDLLDGHQRLAWGVKGDPNAYPPDVVHRLLPRACVISFSAAERGFLPRTLRQHARPDALLCETHGPAGVRFWRGDLHDTVQGAPIDAIDTTGAGDTFFAGTVACLIDRPNATRAAVERGVAAATDLLRERLTRSPAE
jgi:ribokinase